MTLRVLNQYGLSANVSLSPRAGTKWILLSGWTKLVTSATAGTRVLDVEIQIPDNGAQQNNQTLMYITTTTVSSTLLDAVNGQGSFNANLGSGKFDFPPVISVGMALAMLATLIAGDTYDYAILVDEVLDE